MAEEVDEETLVESWEDFEENPDVLDQQLKKLALKQVKTVSQNTTTVVMSDDGTHRSTPYQCSEPKIMILQRPQKDTQQPVNGMLLQKQKQPVKSLQQRQAEYAQARLRIMGTSDSTSEETKIKPLQNRNTLDQQNSNTPDSIKSTSSELSSPENSKPISLSSSSKPIAVIRPSQTSVSIVRNPKGPSETGFRIKPPSNHPS